MYYKWSAYKWSTRSRIKKNSCMCSKNSHSVRISLSFTDSHCEDTSLGPRLRPLSFLSSKTTPCLKSRSNNRSYNWPTKTLNRCLRLTRRLSHRTKATQQWTESLDMSSLSIIKTHLWVPQPVWNYLHCGNLFAIVLPLKVEFNGDVPSLDSWEDRKDWGELTEPEPKELLDN